MKRIIIIGEGYHVGKAFKMAREIETQADVVWISDYEERKYPLSMLRLLLRSGVSPEKWPKIRARIKVDFDRYQQSHNLAPQKVGKIRIDSQGSEVSFLSGRGYISYSFDKVLIFPEATVGNADNLKDLSYLWPGDACVRYLVENWNEIKNPVVVGSDLSLVQAMVCGGKRFTWIRSGSVFSEQTQFFLDEWLMRRGVNIVTAASEEQKQEILKREAGTDLNGRPVFYGGHCSADYARLKQYGLEDRDIQSDFSQDSAQRNIVVSGSSVHKAPGFSNADPESKPADCRRMIRAVLDGDKSSPPPPRNTEIWNMGDLSVVRTGLDFLQARDAGHVCEFALVHGTHGIMDDKPYVLKLIMDKTARNIIGMEAAGEKAHEWANLAACLIRDKTPLEDISDLDIVWTDPVINPFTRCVRMLENKARPGILGITPEELKQSADNGAEFFLLDVRKKQEFARGRLPGAYNIPLDQLKKRIMEIPRFTPIVLYSECSGRAYEGACLLKTMGAKQLYVLDGGYGLYTLDKDLNPLSPESPGFVRGCTGC
ncbi:MAG: rhodanese-like domain-containing protein [Desulfonatronovibrio sp.]